MLNEVGWNCSERSCLSAQFAAAGGFRDLDGDSSLDELGDIGDPHHHQPRGGVPSLLPISTDVSGGSSPTRFGGDDSPHPHEAFQPDFGPGPLHASVNGGGGFGSPFTGGLQRDSRAFGAGFLSFSGLAGPMGPQLSGLQTLSAPLHSLPQARPLRVNPHQMVRLACLSAAMVRIAHIPCVLRCFEYVPRILRCKLLLHRCADIEKPQQCCRAWFRWNTSQVRISCRTPCTYGTRAAPSACRCP